MTDGAFTVCEPGGPEVLVWGEGDPGAPGPGEVLVRHEAISVDFIDVMIRKGRAGFPMPTGIGFAAAGRVAALGEGVSGLSVGDRVAYYTLAAGAYATARVIPADRAIRLANQGMDPAVAAGALFKGLTAWYLATEMRQIKAGEVALLHAAAGGVGVILLQWLNHLGARVVATVGSQDKVALVRGYGCEAVVVRPGDFVEAVRAASGGAGAAIVYESVGKETFAASLEAAARFGMVVSYGWPSGDPDPVPLMSLRSKSLFVTRPTISHYAADAAKLQAGAAMLFELIGKGAIKLEVTHRYPLHEAARAHADLEAGGTTGPVVLVV